MGVRERDRIPQVRGQLHDQPVRTGLREPDARERGGLRPLRPAHHGHVPHLLAPVEARIPTAA
eukprot:6413530-Prymnesium_polylepis.1